MMQLVGLAITSSFTGLVSDKIGRKPVILFCNVGAMAGCVGKWFCRKSFWAFCIAHLCSGLLSGSFPVYLAYISDVFESKSVKDKELGKTVAFFVLGISLGGLVAVLMFPQGLFAPLWAGCILLLFTTIINLRFLVDPDKLKVIQGAIKPELDEELAVLNEKMDTNDNEEGPQHIDKRTLSIIIFGSFADIFGSKSLFPMCVSPLAYQVFYKW